MRKPKSPVAHLCDDHAADVFAKDFDQFIEKMSARYGDDMFQFRLYVLYALNFDSIELEGFDETFRMLAAAHAANLAMHAKAENQAWEEMIEREQKSAKRKPKTSKPRSTK